jgi:hypothetical protein
MNEFANEKKRTNCFIVKNIVHNKVIRIFTYPISPGESRDLLTIPGVAEADIRSSLLKGELLRKLRAKEIVVTCSDIDLLQFNDEQKAFLQESGIVKGLEIDPEQLSFTIDDDLNKLLYYVNEGPVEGFSIGYKAVVGQPFPTSVVWYQDFGNTLKIVEKLIFRNLIKMPTSITWNLYDADGTTIIKSLTDFISYTNNVFETSRARVII